ncbi:MAG: hypothetical protein A4E29_01785 [Methanomassiliicoccales archaeon PtaB.Bin134]|nr:MAG: hypothetical protein A4E29_01785 [Methanomassiliicoccales archaeon PtaB.Bin134]
MTTTDTTTSRIGISRAMSCAAALMPPIRVNLLLEAQPPIRMLKGAKENIAIPSRRASGGSMT